MPFNEPAPNFGLLTSLDLRGLSAAAIFTRSGGYDVSLPTFTGTQGVYEDTLFFLNARGTDGSLNAIEQIDTVASFGSTWSISINSSDRITITADVDFTITSTGSIDALGFSSSVNASLIGSDYVATAPSDWLRGVLVLDDVSYRIDEVGGASTFNIPAITSDIQDVPSWIREPSASDADNFSLSSLQELDNTAQRSSDITWLITDSGLTQCYYRNSLGDISWYNTTIRDLLGFTGDETPVIDGTISRLTSTRKAAGVLIPTRPYQNHHLSVDNISQSRRKIGGGYVSNYIGTYITSNLLFDLDALLDSQDDYRHFTNEFLPLVSNGERLNFYQGWGDSRRSLITADVNSTQPAYDLLYTSEDNGDYGRIRGTLITSEYDLIYPSRLRRRVPVTLEIEHL